jgi:SET domain-containing protein
MARKQQSKANGPGRKLNGHSIRTANGRGTPYAVRRSKIHGRGVFAARTIPKGTRIVEYRGRRIRTNSPRNFIPTRAKRTDPHLPVRDRQRHGDRRGQRGNAARWINHSCKPNCEAVDEDGRIYIEAIRTIRPGEELGYDYNITLEDPHTPQEKRRWPCLCGARSCRGTLLGRKR